MIFVIIMICLSSGCVDHPPKPSFYNDYYKVSITPINNTNYTVIVPVPLLNNNLSILAKDLNITKGSGNYSIVETEKGIGLRIQSDQKIVIERRFKNKRVGELYDKFSMAKIPDYINDIYPSYDYLFYIYGDNITDFIEIRISCHSLGRLGTTINGTISDKGWNEIHGKQSRVVP